MIHSSCVALEHLPLSAQARGGLSHVRQGRHLSHGKLPSTYDHKSLLQTTLVCVCEHVYVPVFIVCVHAYVLVSFPQNWNGGQRATVGVSSFPPTMWVLGPNSLHHAWQQAPLPTQPSHQPPLHSGNVLLAFTDDGEDGSSRARQTLPVHFMGGKVSLESGNSMSTALTGPRWQRQKETGLKCSYYQTQVFHRKTCRETGVGNPFPAKLESEGQGP